MSAPHKTEVGEIAFQCKICPSSFKTENLLKNHGETHATLCLKPFRCEKAINDRGSSHVSLLKTPYRSRQIRQRYYRCLISMYKDGIYPKKKYKCEQCDFSFHSANLLKNHVNAKHSAEFICLECSMGFCDHKTLRRHMDVHLGVVYKCQKCSKSFAQEDTRRQHEKWHERGLS